MYHNKCKGKFQKVLTNWDPISYARLSAVDWRQRTTTMIATLMLRRTIAVTSTSLLRNDGGNANHWRTVQLVGTKSNRDGVGASVKLTSDGFVPVEQAKGG